MTTIHLPLSFRCAAFGAALLLAPVLTAQALGYDGFGNGPLATLHGSAGGMGWTTPWNDVGTDPTGIATVGLQYNGLATTAGAAVTPLAGGVWPSTLCQRSFTPPPVSANAIYVSFLLRADSAANAGGGLSFGQYPYGMMVGAPLGYYTFGLMTSQGVGSLTNKPLVTGETTLVVAKIARNAPGLGITYHLYLDPTIGAAEPSWSDASFALAMVQALPTSLSIDNSTGMTTDEIRVGTTWASVLPAPPSIWTDLGFAKPGVSGAPHLNGSGPLAANTLNSFVLTNANPNASALLVIGFALLNQPFLGGVLVPEPNFVVPLTTDALGAATWQVTLPAGLPALWPVRSQHWITDPAATFGYSASNGLQGVLQ